MLLRPPGSKCGYIIQRCGSGSFYHHAKIIRKTCFMILFDFLSLKNYVNVPSKSRYKHKNIFLVFGWHFEGQQQEKQDPDPNPDPLVRSMDLRIRIHTKMSWIRNSELIN
jgi:hypothetical protein